MTDQPGRPAGEAGDDEQLLGELRLAGELDRPPAEVVAVAKSLVGWCTLDAELAELTYDSLLDLAALAGVRGSAPAGRLLIFASESAGVTVEVEAVAIGARRRLMGQLVPPQAATVEVRHPERSVTVMADEMGRFAADDLPAGPLSLRCRGVEDLDPLAVTTDWVLV